MSRRSPAAWLAIALLLTGAIAPAAALTDNDGQPPVCSNVQITTSEDTAKTGQLDCNDPDPFTYSVGADPTNGTVMIFLVHNMLELQQMMQGIGFGGWSAAGDFHKLASAELSAAV